jgi:hypothetical protein
MYSKVINLESDVLDLIKSGFDPASKSSLKDISQAPSETFANIESLERRLNELKENTS